MTNFLRIADPLPQFLPHTPADWCEIHDRCWTKLTADWQRLSDLKDDPSDGARGFSDLHEWGYAELRLEPVYLETRRIGSTHWYRVAGEGRED